MGLFGRAIRERTSQRTTDYLFDVGFHHAPTLDRFVRDFGVRSLVVSPMIGAVGPLGAIGAFARDRSAFNEHDVAMLEVLAEHAALAVDNARLIAQLRTSREELATRASALEQSEARYRFLVDRSPDLIWTVDDEERLTFLNDRVESLLGYTPGDLLGHPVFELVHEDSIDEIRRRWTRGRHRSQRRADLLASTCAIATAGRCRSSCARSASWSTASCAASRARCATRPNANGSSATCANRSSATASSSRTRPDLIAAVDTQGRLSYVSGRSADVHRLDGRRADRPAVVGAGGARDAAGDARRLAAPARGARGRPAVPRQPAAPQRARRPGRGPLGRHRGRRGVRRLPGIDPRHARSRPAGARAPPPGSRDCRKPGTREARPGAARLGDPGALLA